MSGLFAGVSTRGRVLFAAFLAFLIVAPLFLNDYWLAIIIIVCYLGYTGQSWNLMLGFAGLLSIGQALFIGVGAYTGAALFVHFGVPPALGIFAAILVAVVAGSIIGALGFRFEIRGVYFALLTIAFAEFVRIMVDHSRWLGGTAGLFLPVQNREGIDLLNLRGSPLMFYYIILFLNFGALALCRWLLAGRLGYYWQAIRDDHDAAQALGINVFRYKMIAVMISSAMAGVAGVFYAFYYNNLFPEQIFSVEQSVQVTFAPIVGGVGTLFGPILGAFILTPLGRVLSTLTEHWNLPGIQLLFWGICVAGIVLFRPAGIWPWMARTLRLTVRPGKDE
jgi:branched-chain amino acid transport system permease protein